MLIFEANWGRFYYVLFLSKIAQELVKHFHKIGSGV